MNTFGLSSSQKWPIYDAQYVRTCRTRLGRDRIPALDRANSIYVPSGRWPARGWLLLRCEDYDLIDPYQTALQLEVGDPSAADNVGVLRNLTVVQAQCVTRGIAADEDAIYLVEVTDGRGMLHNQWFQAPTSSKYNIRAPAYPQTFHPDSMDGGTTWTWSRMLEDLWEQMTPLGAWPGLPAGVTIKGTPEGFWFNGVPAWHSLCDVLDYLGLTVACDLTQASPYTIVKPGTADAAYAALEAKYGPGGQEPRLEEDLEWRDVGAGRVPAVVKVYFRRRNSVYGTEETVRYDSLQWDMATRREVSVGAPAAFSGASGVHHFWSDFTVRHDQDGVPLAEDTAEATAIAEERAGSYFARIYRQTLGYMHRTYAGALPFTTGSMVDGVCFFQDYRRGQEDRQGWRTEVVRGAAPPWDNIY